VTTAAVATNFESMRASVQERILAQLPEHLSRLQWNADRIRAHQTASLRALLRHAADNSPFHHRRLANVDPENVTLSDLPSLPVMTKAQMMESLDEVLTDRRLARDELDRALQDTAAEPRPVLGSYTALASGGTSGFRGVYAFDRDAWSYFILSVTRSLIARLHAAGGPPPGGLRIAMVGAPSAVHATGSAAAWTATGDIPVHYLAVPATLPVPVIVERLNALQPPALCGYPSMLARLAEERQAGRLRIAPQMISTTSETLVPELRRLIAAGFGTPIVDVFGSSEGLVGVTAPDDDVLVFNTDLCIVELVDAEYRPVAPGMPSAKILVTNLYNRVQPLIRYELDDRFVRAPDAPEHGHLRAFVQGRSGKVLNYDGINVHPIAVDDVMEKAPGVLDYQVHQTQQGIDVDVLAFVSIDTRRLGIQLTDALVAAGLRQPRVTVTVVEQLERRKDSGKIDRFLAR
jgi:phenylacetate-CoA ligase